MEYPFAPTLFLQMRLFLEDVIQFLEFDEALVSMHLISLEIHLPLLITDSA